jgi:hypothetical protein
MLNLNRTWVQKQGDFFVESPIILFAAIIWFLKLYKSGKYCTFPHAVEFLNRYGKRGANYDADAVSLGLEKIPVDIRLNFEK